MIKGSSFNLDTKDPRKTRVHGNSLQIDLDILEIVTGGGVLKYSPTHTEFVSLYLSASLSLTVCPQQKGLVRWLSSYNEEKFSLNFNDKLVYQIYAPDESPYFQFNMPFGNGVFRDILLDKSFSQKVCSSFVCHLFVCLKDVLLGGSSVVFD